MVFPQSAMESSGTSSPKTHIVKASHGFSFDVPKGERFRVVDLYGEQVGKGGVIGA